MDEKKPKVFISYVRDDRERVLMLFNDLENSGCDPWMDTRKLLPGQNWKLHIKEAITSSDFFLACLSQNSVSKVGFFQSELREGYEVLKQYPTSKIYFIPVRFDDCSIPFEIKDFHWVDIFVTDGLKNLLKALQHEWKSRGLTWPSSTHSVLASSFHEQHEAEPFGNVMAFVRNLVFLRERKTLEELRTIVSKGLEEFSDPTDLGVINYVWSATLRSFAKKEGNKSFLDEALKVALKSTELAPNNSDSWLESAQVYRDMGSIAKAREYYELCLRVDSEKDECLTSYAMMLQQHCETSDSAGQEKIILLLEHLVRIRPHDMMSHDVLGTKYLFQRKDYDKAKHHFSQIRDGIDASAYGRKQKAVMSFHQGQYFEEIGDLKSALTYYEKSFSYAQHPNCERRIAAIKRRLSG